MTRLNKRFAFIILSRINQLILNILFLWIVIYIFETDKGKCNFLHTPWKFQDNKFNKIIFSFLFGFLLTTYSNWKARNQFVILIKHVELNDPRCQWLHPQKWRQTFAWMGKLRYHCNLWSSGGNKFALT